jgi:hypothetical protein
VTAAEKRKVDEATYEDLLRTWRFTWAGDPLFQDGTYWTVLSRRRKQVGVDEHIRISERVGWPDPFPVPAPSPEEYWSDMKDWAHNTGKYRKNGS